MDYAREFGRPPRWFDRVLCFLGWALLLTFAHCVAKQDWRFPTVNEDIPVTAPDAGGRPGW